MKHPMRLLLLAVMTLAPAAAHAQDPCVPAYATHISWRPMVTNVIQLIWAKSTTETSNPTSFAIEVGSGPGLSDAAVINPSSVVTTNTHNSFVLSAGTFFARLLGGRTCNSLRVVSEEIQVIAGQAQGSSQVRVNEVAMREGSSPASLEFVELKNFGSSNVNIGNWKVFTGSFNNAYYAATIPAGTIIPAGCTYVVARSGSSVISDIQGNDLLGRSAAVVDSFGRIRDSVAVAEDNDGGQQYPLVETTVLANRSTGSYQRHADSDSNNNTSDYSYQTTASPSAAIFCGANGILPSAPTEFAASVSGTTVTFTWSRPIIGLPLTQYTLEIGRSSGATDVLTRALAPPLTMRAEELAGGTYFARLKAVSNQGTSPASNEVSFVIGSASPGAPSALAAMVSGRTVTFSWQAPTSGATPTAYLLEAGNAPGLSNVATFNTGSTALGLQVTNVTPGTYYVRVRALNGSVSGGASNEITVIVQ